MLQNFIQSRAIALNPPTFNSTCDQCSGGLIKYIEFIDFPDEPITFFIANNPSPSGSNGVIQVHTWSQIPNSSPPPVGRIWVADVLPGSSFRFRPTASNRFLSLNKRNGSNVFDAICFDYIDEIKTFIPQTY